MLAALTVIWLFSQVALTMLLSKLSTKSYIRSRLVAVLRVLWLLRQIELAIAVIIE